MKQSKFYQIKNITEHEYTLVGCDGNVITLPIQEVNKTASAFTIQDAKPGDILSVGTQVFIFQKLDSDVYSYCYCWIGYPWDGKPFAVYNNKYCALHADIRPATQEEKDLLFQKIDEAGYEWDTEKLELRKKKWQPKNGDTVWFCWFSFETSFCVDFAIYKSGENKWFYFQTKEECQAFCDKLNAAIKSVLEERRKEAEE